MVVAAAEDEAVLAPDEAGGELPADGFDGGAEGEALGISVGDIEACAGRQNRVAAGTEGVGEEGQEPLCRHVVVLARRSRWPRGAKAAALTTSIVARLARLRCRATTDAGRGGGRVGG